MLYGKVLFGSPNVKGFVGGGVGIGFSKVKYFTQNVQIESEDSGFLAGGLAGLNFFLSRTILLNANYSLNYLSNSYYNDFIRWSFLNPLGIFRILWFQPWHG